MAQGQRENWKRTSFLAVISLLLACVMTPLVFIPPYMGLGATLGLCLFAPVCAIVALVFTRRQGNRVRGTVWAVLAILLTIIGIAGALILDHTSTERMISLGRDRGEVYCRPYEWPAGNPIAKQIPKPEAPLAEIDMDGESVFRAYMCLVSRDTFDSYVQQVQREGFTELRSTDTIFYGENAQGLTIYIEYVNNDGGVMVIYV